MEDKNTPIKTEEETQATVAPAPVEVAPISEEVVLQESTEQTTPVKDRSAYNCPDCGGEGLKKDILGSLVDCNLCHNTGKLGDN